MFSTTEQTPLDPAAARCPPCLAPQACDEVADVSPAEGATLGARSANNDYPRRWRHAYMEASIDPVWKLLMGRGRKLEVEPGVSVLDHSLRCATLALESGADAMLVTACLLHDIGHLLRDDFAPGAGRGSSDHHDVFGAAFLTPWFGPRIVEPIGMHVAAKRYLCAAEPAYFRQLSSASKTDLVSQGGPLTPAEAAAFAAQPYAPLAIRLCRMDDRSAEIAAPRSLALFWDLAQDCRRESDAGSPQR